jgi:hypothetical protein
VVIDRCCVCRRLAAGGWRLSFRQRQQHRHAALVVAIGVAVERDQVALFQEFHRDQDVTGGAEREQQVADAHRRRRPERDQETEHQRMAHDAVEGAGHERLFALFAAGTRPAAVVPHLFQTEQVEMVDQERAREHQQPAQRRQSVQREARGFVLDVPQRLRQRPPLPEQQDQHQAGQQHVGAAFDRLRHDPRPPAFECRPRHAAVLHGEQAEQGEIDRQRGGEIAGRAAVDVLGHAEAGDKADRVQEGDEEHRVADDAVEQGKAADEGVAGGDLL